MVIFAHVPEIIHGDRRSEFLTLIFGTISFGELAVDGFFILSGYLICKSWCTRPNLRVFIANRFLRIFPGFLVSALVCALVVGPAFGADDYFAKFDWRAFVAGLLRFGFSGVPAAFSGTHYPAINGPLWTIPWEFKCYLLVAVSGVMGVFQRSWFWPAVFFVCALIYFFAGLGFKVYVPENYYRLGMVFAAGACFYKYEKAIPWRFEWALLAFLVFFLLLFFKPAAEIAVSIFFGYVVIFFALHARVFEGFNKLPDVSYGVYLYAWPLNKIVLWYAPNIGVAGCVVVVLTLSCCAGWLSWHLVEKPFLRLKLR